MSERAKKRTDSVSVPDQKTDVGAKTNLDQKSDPSGPRPEMPAAVVIDTFADIAKRSVNLFRMYTERLERDDGYRVMDPRTVASTFQEFFQKAAVDPASIAKQQLGLWSDLALLWQRTATRVLLNSEVE